jgi:hypothetical protein
MAAIPADHARPKSCPAKLGRNLGCPVKPETVHFAIAPVETA